MQTDRAPPVKAQFLGATKKKVLHGFASDA